MGQELAYAGRTVYLTGKTGLGDRTGRHGRSTIEGNTLDTLRFAQAASRAGVGFAPTGSSSTRAGSRAGCPTGRCHMDPIVREERSAPGHTERYVLYKVDRQDVTGKLLAKAEPQQDDHYQPAVGFTFNRQGGRKFGILTSEHLPEEGGNFKYQLAILLDGVVQSAPSINSEIRDSGIIEGGQSGFSSKELDFLITVLRSGSLPASLNPEPLQEENVGADARRRHDRQGDLRAIVISMIVVPVFMIVYYRFAGVVAVDRLDAEHPPAGRLDGVPGGQLHPARPGRAWP